MRHRKKVTKPQKNPSNFTSWLSRVLCSHRTGNVRRSLPPTVSWDKRPHSCAVLAQAGRRSLGLFSSHGPRQTDHDRDTAG